MSQSSSSQEEKVSPHEYARQNGLAQDYLAANLEIPELFDIRSRSVNNVDDDAKLPLFDLGPQLKVEERLACSREAASLLSWLTREESSDEINDIVAPLFKDTDCIRKKKLELPLLRTDVDTDSRNFASREGFEISVQDIKLPLEAVAQGEGFDWIEQYKNLGGEILRDLKLEKISVTREAMVFLQACMTVSWTEEDDRELWAREQKYQRVGWAQNIKTLLILLQRTVLDPITPPLSPLPSIPQPFEPSSSDSAMQVPVFSDPPSPTKQDLEALEKEIFKQDLPTPLRSLSAGCKIEGLSEEMPAALGNLYSSPGGLDQSQSEPRPSRWEDFKLEVPLMPNEPATIPKIVRFKEVIEEHQFTPTTSLVVPDDGSAFFENICRDAYFKANQEVEHEKLSIENITARVDVPELNFDKPNAPWKKFEEIQSQAALSALQKSFVLEQVASSVPTWPGPRKETKLPWAPFSGSFAKLALEDDALVDDTTWKAFVEDDGDVIDSSSVTWKAAGLRILIDEDHEEKIEFGQFRKDTQPDLSSIVKKRKVELQEREKLNSDPTGIVLPDSRLSLTKNARKTATTAAHAVNEDFGLLGGAFSAQASLNNYLEIRGVKRPKMAESSYFSKPPIEKILTERKGEHHARATLDIAIRKSPANRQSLPVPSLQKLISPTWVVVSTTLLKNRSLIKSIEAQSPALTLIERDFTAHNTSAWSPGSVSRIPIVSPLDAEADFIVSPSVGIILTTLQKIKQKPPRDKTKSKIRERLDKVSLRYEKLVLLVSEGNEDGVAAGLAEGDCLAFADFTGYISGLETSISLQFVGGGEEILSKWIVSSIIQYRVDTDLLADETYWELFLRRAGLNAFAAQAVVVNLRAPDGVHAGSPSKIGHFGLTAFVEMGKQQRIARFGNICGQKVLSRVSAVLDATWQ
ncbi:uncharacterized protein RSE6_05850 [Rhynchosporium secalis]|uniref:Uncharacterized protein n=1 Tax=Rhynchosporium secalis TaxID=38038 RepID=A0A1E1M8V5_RHYSE|nr:uncharacterized protein RSE6_05850 [Rhynchosporium secalis]